VRLLGLPLGSRLAEFKMFRCSGYSWVTISSFPRLQEVLSCVQGGLRRSGGAQSSRMVA
jgi:hypothetical protein